MGTAYKTEELGQRGSSIAIKEVNGISSTEDTLPVGPRLTTIVCVYDKRERMRETIGELITREGA